MSKYSKPEIYEKLNVIFRDLFDDESIQLNDKTTADDIEDWDSLEHINMVSAVEKTFGMRFLTKEVSSMKNVGEMVEIIMSRT